MGGAQAIPIANFNQMMGITMLHPSYDYFARGTPIFGHQTVIGHASQRGVFGVQISRPSEIMFTCSE
jgi:hypothetical protein